VVGIVSDAGAELAGIVVAIDRQERGTGELSAVRELEQALGAPVNAIVTLDDVVDYLEESGRHDEHLAAMRTYRDEFSAK
jgi:orotate phosphoribosyltransferase